MLIVIRKETNPYFNIAAEEYFLKNFNENIFMLWTNEPSVIIGKHQNAYSEIDYEFVKRNNLPVIRRISGGGTVYHDLGNINFTFIYNIPENENKLDKNRFTPKIVEILNKIGLKGIKIENRNSLSINGLKFSGNSEHLWKNRILHHGTILYSSNLQNLINIINKNNKIYIDNSVKSVISKVTNICDFFHKKINKEEFIELIIKQFTEINFPTSYYTLNQFDIDSINNLVENKYSKFEWNYGYLSYYNFKNKIKINNEIICTDIVVENGIIKKISFKNFSNIFLENSIINKLTNTLHYEDSVKIIIKEIYKLSDYKSEIQIDDLIKLLF